MKTRYSFLIATLLSCSAAFSHHSVVGAFDTETFVTFEVELLAFQLINPHPFMIAKRTDGSDELLTLDMDNTREITALNIAPDTFLPGDELLVTALPSRTSSTTFYVTAVGHPRLGFRYETVVQGESKLICDGSGPCLD